MQCHHLSLLPLLSLLPTPNSIYEALTPVTTRRAGSQLCHSPCSVPCPVLWVCPRGDMPKSELGRWSGILRAFLLTCSQQRAAKEARLKPERLFFLRLSTWQAEQTDKWRSRDGCKCPGRQRCQCSAQGRCLGKACWLTCLPLRIHLHVLFI